MKGDSIPICRSVLKHWIYKDSEHLKVWLTMLARARWKDEPKTDTYQGFLYTINRGEFIFGRPSWSEKVGITDGKLKRLIKLLVKDEMIEVISKTSKFTIYKITNYEKFNQQETQKNQGLEGSDDQQTTNRRPADDQQTTNKEEREEGKDCLSYVEIQKSFNEICASLPKIKQMTEQRKKHLKTRLSEIDNDVDYLFEIFASVEASDFLTNRKNDNRNNWRADFDWIINQTNFAKIVEGKYRNKQQPSKKVNIL